MVEEFYALYNTLASYKKSIIKNLDKIDGYLSQEFDDYGDLRSKEFLAKKYNISKDMLAVLQTYIKILFLSESAAQELITKLDHDRPPERDEFRRNSNPFHITPFTSVFKTPESIFIKPEVEHENTISNFDESESDLISNTETIVGSVTNNLGQLPEEKSSPSHFEDVKVLEEFAVESMEVSPIAACDQQAEEVSPIAVHDQQVEEVSPIAVCDQQVEEIPEVQVEEVEVAITNIKIEEETNLEMTPVRELTPEVKVETIIEPVPKLETSKPEVLPPPESKYTALTKLLNMTVHDRKKEAEKRYEKYHIQKEFKWRMIPKTSGSSERKIRVPKSSIFEIEDDVLVAQRDCIFSHIETPTEFYVRTNQELFESLENSLNEDLNSQYHYVIGKYKSKQEARAIVGNFCFVFLANKRKWFRVQVIDWMESEAEQILVQLIDYGEKFLCRYENLKCMMELYSEFPKMAIKCHFAGICSPDDNDKHRWPQGSIDALIELSEMKEKSKFLIIYVHKEGDSYGVELIKEKSNQPLARTLIELKLAVYENTAGDKLSAIYEEEEEEEELEDHNLNEIIAGYDAQDEARICPFTDDSGKCFKGPSCKLEHSNLAPDGITTDKASIITQALTELRLPSAEEYIDIVITGYINTCHFYAHIIRERTGSNLYNDDFHKLIEIMNSNNIVHTYEPFKLYPGIGEVILVKHGHQWYRAKCVEHRDNQVKVSMVDFGLDFTKKMAEIRQIKDDLLYLPFQAVECVLDTCCEKAGVSYTQSREFYESCMQFKNFKAYVVSANKPLRLKLYDDKNLDMDYVLKEYGLGQDRDNNLYPNKDCFVQLM